MSCKRKTSFTGYQNRKCFFLGSLKQNKSSLAHAAWSCCCCFWFSTSNKLYVSDQNRCAWRLFRHALKTSNWQLIFYIFNQLYLWHFVVYGLLLPVAWVTCVTIDCIDGCWPTCRIGRIVFGHVNDVDSDAIRESLSRAKIGRYCSPRRRIGYLRSAQIAADRQAFHLSVRSHLLFFLIDMLGGVAMFVDCICISPHR